jgi:DNA repair exonuclease SbcCD nuclease subunit
MSFVFLHTADWQIGRRFGGLPAEVAAVLAEARFEVIEKLAAIGRAEGIKHVLVAGDVFDAEMLAPKSIAQAVGRMRLNTDLRWHLLPGNHDPHRAGGLWDRLLNQDLPSNVRAHVTLEAFEIEPGVWLLPAPLTSKATARDPTSHMAGMATPQGAIRIGLAHGSIRRFGDGMSGAALIAVDLAETAGLDYLALGDWHGTLRVDQRSWYSGTPEADRYAGNNSGNVLAVRLDGARNEPRVRALRAGRFHWLSKSVAVASSQDFDTVLKEIEAVSAPSNVLLELALSGSLSPSDGVEIRRRLALLGSELRHLEANLEGIRARPGSTREALNSLNGGVRRVAEQLIQNIERAPPEQQSAAQEALAILADLAHEVGPTR